MLVRRRNRPSGVTRSASVRKNRRSSSSAGGRMVRSLSIRNGRPPSPGRTWRNRTGAPIVARTASAATAITGASTTSPTEAPSTSMARLSPRSTALRRVGRTVLVPGLAAAEGRGGAGKATGMILPMPSTPRTRHGAARPTSGRRGSPIRGRRPILARWSTRTIAVLTSGGDAPGMNCGVRAVTKVAASRGGLQWTGSGGYTGLRAGRVASADPRAGRQGRAPARDRLLGLARGHDPRLGPRAAVPRRRPGGRRRSGACAGYAGPGGDRRQRVARGCARPRGRVRLPVVGMPASIDNDVGCSGSAIGVDTALNTIVAACDRISDTARAHRRAFVVEVMGRDCGYLAMARRDRGRRRRGAVPRAGARRGRDRRLGRAGDARAFASGAASGGSSSSRPRGSSVPCTQLVRLVQERLGDDLPGVDVRATVLGHLVRGGNPCFQDRMVAGRLGLPRCARCSRGAPT